MLLIKENRDCCKQTVATRVLLCLFDTRLRSQCSTEPLEKPLIQSMEFSGQLL